MTDRDYLEQLQQDLHGLREEVRLGFARLSQEQLAAENRRREDREYFEGLMREMWGSLSSASRTGTSLSHELATRLSTIEGRISRLEENINTLQAAADELRRFTRANLTVAQRNFENVGYNLETLRESIALARVSLEAVRAEAQEPVHRQRLDQLEARLANLEQQAGLPED